MIKKLTDFVKGLGKKKSIALYVAMLAVALALYFLSSYTGGMSCAKSESKTQATQQSGDDMEQRLVRVLSCIRGAGKMEVMVTYETTDEVVTAMTRQIDEQSSGTEGQSGSTFIEQRSETVQPATITTENGQEAIVLYKREPELRGVVVVAQGAADLTVRLNLQRAVQAVTGLPLCAIEVLEMGYDED